MSATTPVLEKNGKGYIIRVSNLGTLIGIIVGILTIISIALLPYKTFTEFKEQSTADRKEIRTIATTADSLARFGNRYAIENNYNMKVFFELGQPKNFKWLSYEEIKKKIYLQ